MYKVHHEIFAIQSRLHSTHSFSLDSSEDIEATIAFENLCAKTVEELTWQDCSQLSPRLVAGRLGCVWAAKSSFRCSWCPHPSH